jgi:cobalt-zinc-cadmium efflux system outer membrane protein
MGFTHDNLTESGNQPNSLQVLLGLRLPVFDRGQHDERRAEQHAIEVGQELEGSLRAAEAEARALLARQAALASVRQRLDDEALPKSRQVLEASTTAFNRGQISLTDVLLTRRTHTELLLREIDLAFDSFGVRNDLRHALGVDSELFAGLERHPQP